MINFVVLIAVLYYLLWFINVNEQIIKKWAFVISLLKEDETDQSIEESDEIMHINRDSENCPCKYGRCVWKGTRKECVCDPEFGRVSNSECRYCDCGRGFNCTFSGPYDRYSMKANCICTEGYYDSGYSCRALCNSTHPCQNGGTCWNGRCKCMEGTMGDFCEHIFWCSYECRPRLIVDCVYDQENKNYACLCKNRSLLFDYEEQVCKRNNEAHFWLNGYVNKQNCRIWSEANPQVYVETPLYPEKLTVWCALWAGGILQNR
ncbi:uncharacterized protein TNCV_2216191 [Trichonephila clavipes]|nr:uncharacterized protein TNCV_2216191 [Trichonephila clavipes]